MKKEYIFISLIVIIFLLWYLIISFTIKEYKINLDIKFIENLTIKLESEIESAKKVIEYKTSKAYKNRILKEQQSFKNNWEDVVYFTSEESFNKYTTKKDFTEKEKIITKDELELKIDDLSIFERWVYFIFKKHPDKTK